jgi:hypothetical protein
MLPVRIVFSTLFWKFYTGADRIVAKILHFGRETYNEEGPGRNPGLLKIQYPMKNQYTNGVRAS